MSTILAAAGDTIPLALVVEDGATTLFPVARVFSSAGAPVGSPIDLLHVSAGFYLASFIVPAAEKYVVRYDIFADALHTQDLSSRRGKGEDLIIADIDTVFGAAVADAVWDAPRAAHGIVGSFGEALRTIFGVSAKANFRIDDMVYDAQAFLLTARLRVFPDATTAAASTPGGTGEGEIHTLTLTGAPNGTFPQLPDTVLGLLP